MRKLFISLTALLIASPSLAASPDEARSYIQSLDRAIAASKTILEANNASAFAQNSHTMKTLEEEGGKFGSKAFDEPYGYCFASGASARNWWQSALNKETTGKENPPGGIASAAEKYHDHKTACLAAADEEETKK